MKLFKRRKENSRGSITALVALLLVPMIVLNGFMVDLSRLKLYGNQAVMTADNYGEAILSIYDNLLKDLYGLFAVTQNDAAATSLETLDEYMQKYIASSFAPAENTIGWRNFTSVGSMLNKPYSGFMPYSNAKVKLEYKECKGANLETDEVLATQIGDFMKFRIVQSVLSDGSAILEAFDQIENSQNNTEVVKTKKEFDDIAGELLKEMQNYYYELKKLVEYPAFIESVNNACQDAMDDLDELIGSNAYADAYMHYRMKKEAVDDVIDRYGYPAESEFSTDEESALYSLYDKCQTTEGATEDEMKEAFDDIVEDYKESFDSDPIDFDSYSTVVNALDTYAASVESLYGDIINKRNELEDDLNNEDISAELKDGIEQEIAMLDSILDAGGTTVEGKYSADNFKKIVEIAKDNSEDNTAYEKNASNNADLLAAITNAYFQTNVPPEPDFVDCNLNTYRDILKDSDLTELKELYEALQKTFEKDGGEAESEAQSRIDNAEKQVAESEEELKNMDVSDARDIPANVASSFNTSNAEVKSFKIAEMIAEASDLFTQDSLSEMGNMALLKLYMIQYSFGMFSSRVTGVPEPDDSNDAVNTTGDSDKTTTEYSLTGYELCRKINYLYNAELEYIFGGSSSSTSNLNHVRNYILAFRAVMNYAATYSVSQINTIIQSIANAASLATANPVTGLAVSAALRMAVAAAETAADWKVLMERKSVVVIKNDIDDLSLGEKIYDILGKSGGPGSGRSEFELDYEQYLTILLSVLTSTDNITNRIGHLISLNISSVKQGIGENGTLSNLTFNMKDAFTAVDATCSVQLDFAVIPPYMARMLVGDDGYSVLETQSKNTYKFTVTRGY